MIVGWEEEFRTLMLGHWMPGFHQGMLCARMMADNVEIVLIPPQGIYGRWRCLSVERGCRVAARSEGRTAAEALKALPPSEDAGSVG